MYTHICLPFSLLFFNSIFYATPQDSSSEVLHEDVKIHSPTTPNLEVNVLKPNRKSWIPMMYMIYWGNLDIVISLVSPNS
jgi:hypothetical protein